MHIEDNDIVADLLECESTGMTIQVFMVLNTMDIDRRKRIYQLLEVAKMFRNSQSKNSNCN